MNLDLFDGGQRSHKERRIVASDVPTAFEWMRRQALAPGIRFVPARASALMLK
jgi:hypothetical protein